MMSTQRAARTAATGARLLVGAVVCAAVVVGTVLAVSAPWPGVTPQPAQAEITPLPGDTILVCNGDLRALGRDAASPLDMESAATARFTGESSGASFDVGDIAVDDLADAGQIRRLVGQVEGRVAPLIGATESLRIDEDDLAGFAAAPCREAGMESWLVGGSVETGSSDLIVLTNPGAVTSTVALTVFGSVRASTSVLVPAQSQLALPLASIASGSDAPVVRVEAAGSPVRAVLQSSLTQTLDPVGVDLQDAVASPQRTPVIPGVEIFQDEGDGASSAVVRLLAPEEFTEARVTVTAVGESTPASSFDVELEAGMPMELGLSGMDPGMYTVQVSADAGVLAAVREKNGSGPGSDFAWATPAPAIGDEVLAAIPVGPSAALYLANDDDQDVTVRVQDVSGGEAQEVVVPAGSSAEVEVDARTVYALAPSGPVHASVAMSGNGALATWPVWPPAGTEKSIVVYP